MNIPAAVQGLAGPAPTLVAGRWARAPLSQDGTRTGPAVGELETLTGPRAIAAGEGADRLGTLSIRLFLSVCPPPQSCLSLSSSVSWKAS